MQQRRGLYAGVDIPEFYELVEALFKPREAEVNNALTTRPTTAADVAEQMQRDPEEVTATLESMADRGLCATFVQDGTRYYRGVPFMPGIFEYQFMPGGRSRRDRDLARLIHRYKQAWEEHAGPQRITFPLTRVIPVDRTIAAGNTVHTYDQVATYIDKYDTIGVGTCYCRHAALLRDEDVHDLPMEVCLWFGKAAEHAIERLNGRRLSKEEARAILDRTEAAGLVHMSRNTTDEIDFLCSCDRWHCEVITQVLKQPKPGWAFNSGYRPLFDDQLCVACETCLERCPAEALAMGPEEVPQVDLERCFGCGLCASGCSEGAVAMEPKPEYPPPPRNVREFIAGLKAASGKQ
jgi:Pyruvate/2-oxoacid:ferredoxin oxidoreductase delta subunit